MSEHATKESTRQDPVQSLLISQGMVAYLEYIQFEDGRGALTLDRYRRHLERFTRTVGDSPVTDIGNEKVWLFKRRLVEQGLGPATISGNLSCLRGLLKYLRDVKHLSVYDPAQIRRPKIPKRNVEYLTKEEVQRFIEAIPTNTLTGLRDRALVEVLCSTGMRISEALSLDRDRIDWEKQEAVIIGKGNAQRKVYFVENAIGWLRRYLEARWDGDQAVFVTNGGTPTLLRSDGGWRRFHRYGKLAGLARPIYPHLLRHTMATTLLSNGCPIGHIRTLLGHAHLATTCKYYLGVISDAEVKAAHKRYLSYEVEKDEVVDDPMQRQENIKGDELTEKAARVE